MPPEIEAIKHIGNWVDGKLVCVPDCPSITHKKDKMPPKTNEGRPWLKKFYASRERASKKGWEHTMTKEDFEEFWYRDEAWKLERPSIDRIDNKKGYTRENCRFIELRENQARDNRGRTTTEKQREHSIRHLTGYWKGKRKLTAIQVRKIRRLIAGGKKTLKEIGNLFECDRTIIAHIKNKETYADIK